MHIQKKEVPLAPLFFAVLSIWDNPHSAIDDDSRLR